MTLLHQTPNQRNGIGPPEKRQDATGDLIDSKPFKGLGDYYLGWPDRHWYPRVGRLTNRWNEPGVLRQKQEAVDIRVPGKASKEAIPGRSARGRYADHPAKVLI